MDNFFIVYGPVIAGIVSGLFTIATPLLNSERRGSIKSQKREIIVPAIALVSLVIGIVLLLKFWVPKDEWHVWDQELSQKIEKYLEHYNEFEDKELKSVKRAFSETQKLIPEIKSSQNAAGLFYHDIRVGSILMKNKTIRNVCYRYFGIDGNKFLGSGSTLPWRHTGEYKNADAREYLVPNLPETNEHVWTWEFKRSKLDLKAKKIKDIIASVPPTDQSNNNDISENLNKINDARTSVTSEPPVIRFQNFPRRHYRGTLGRPESYRVFTISLQDVWDMNLDDAIKASGLIWNPDNSYEEDETLFIWLFFPFHAKEVVPATWGNVVQNTNDWLERGNSRSN